MAARWSLSLVGCSLLMLIPVHFCDGADPSDKSTFHDTRHLLWKDCGDSNAWITFTAFDLSPSPLHIPGNGTITIHVQNGNTAFDKNVAIVVTMQKHLLGLWSHIPCTGPTTPTDQRLGSCTYRDPCDFISSRFPGGSCPEFFNREGLPCTCPFTIPAHKVLNMNNWPLTFAARRADLTWLTTGEYYIKFAMYETGQAIARMCFEAYVNLDIDRYAYNPVPTTQVPTHQISVLTTQGPQGFQWQSNPADGATLNILTGDDVTIPWTYTASSGDVISGINWYFRGASEELVAMFTHSMFRALPAFSGRVQQANNGGLTLKHVTLGDSGTYSVEVTGQDANGHYFTYSRSVNLHVSGFHWQGNTADGETRSVTQGNDVTIPWTFTTHGVIGSVTWFFKVTSEEIVAEFTHNQFFVLPAFSGRVQQVTNGGITLKHVTVSDSGTYIVEVTGHDVNGTAFTQRRSLVLHVNVV